MKTAALMMAASLIALAGVSAFPTAAAEEDYTIAECLLRDDGHPPEHCIEDCTTEPHDPLHCDDHA